MGAVFLGEQFSGKGRTIFWEAIFQGAIFQGAFFRGAFFLEPMKLNKIKSC